MDHAKSTIYMFAGGFFNFDAIYELYNYNIKELLSEKIHHTIKREKKNLSSISNQKTKAKYL